MFFIQLPFVAFCRAEALGEQKGWPVVGAQIFGYLGGWFRRVRKLIGRCQGSVVDHYKDFPCHSKFSMFASPIVSFLSSPCVAA